MASVAQFVAKFPPPLISMPLLSIGAAILILGNTEELPWTSETWQGLMKFFAILWETPNGAAPDTLSPHVLSWNTQIAQSVKSYVENLHSKMDQQVQIDYATCGFSDNNSLGSQLGTIGLMSIGRTAGSFTGRSTNCLQNTSVLLTMPSPAPNWRRYVVCLLHSFAILIMI